MSTLWQNIQHKILRSGNNIRLLISINVIVFLAINISAVFEYMLTPQGHVSLVSLFAEKYINLSADLHELPFRFWTPFTYMFMHSGILHILFNMLWLYWMGQIFEEYLGNKRTIGLYIMGGLAGALFYLLAFNLLPVFTSVNAAYNSAIVGASASVMAIVVATATLLPDYTISLILFGPVKLKWLVFVILVIDFLGIMGGNAGGEIAHLGGALMGFIYIKQLQKGNDWVGGIAKLFKPKPKLKVVSNNMGSGSSGYPRQDEIDRILDKISQSGYNSLSRQERETLKRASKQD
ncbi:membrane associated rhomboid family serine protease [Mucilaginibacter oryzae]|uniref:Membrane associated rhomboid family serine protease n=1 Tax=Mucilaginibacter oryzae TaxID=468058 RepID=A0A316H1I4_9SPHI|nr:rhomboid family intramembrane serine protease [Mucilaginibacter oryzae]PWK72530.1 membrane associated rhomboid family serine protease [Mucilaginibacter oryzae]